MPEEIDLSIVVPVYNTAQFVEQCLLSLCKQNYDPSRFEVLVVDDGSTDCSADIVKRLQKIFVNIEYFWQTNGRQGKARNTGIRYARGRYIAFVDSDDSWRYDNVISTLIPICDQQDLDILQSSKFLDIGEHDTHPLERNSFDSDLKIYGREDYLRLREFSYAVIFSIYKTSIIKDKKFREGVVFEDSDWPISAIWSVGKTGKIGRICWAYYCYRSNPNSTTHKPRLSTYYDNVKGIVSIVRLLDLYDDMDSFTRCACMNRVKTSMLSWIGISRNYRVNESVKVFSFAKKEGLLDLRFPRLSHTDRFMLVMIRYTPLRYTILFSVRCAVLLKRFFLKWLKK